MLKRTTLAAAGLAATVGLPYLMDKSEQVGLPTAAKSPDTEIQGAVAAQQPTAELGPLPLTHPQRIQEPKRIELEEVFRFQNSHAWILGKWPRVSTAPGGLDLQGYRVVLVTGTQEDDLAGSLTYYFSAKHRLQRITFRGTTGDSRRLVGLMQSRFGMRRIAAGPGIFQYESKIGTRRVGNLQVTPARVVDAALPHQRFQVALELSRPFAD